MQYFPIKRWYIDDVELEGETAHTLILHNVQRDKHGKVLACEGTNEVGSIRRTYTLTVECKYLIKFNYFRLSF